MIWQHIANIQTCFRVANENWQNFALVTRCLKCGYILPHGVTENFVAACRDRLAKENLSVRAAAKRAGIPVRSFQAVLDGHQPSIARAAEICDGLDIQFHIGPSPEPALLAPQPVPWWEPFRGLLGPVCPVVLARRFQQALLGVGDSPDDPATMGAPGPNCPHPMLCGDGCRIMAVAARDVTEIELNHGVFTTTVPMPESTTSVHISPHGCAWFGAGMLAALNLDPKRCKSVEIRDDAMAPALPARSVALIDERRKELREGSVYALDTPCGIVMRRARRLEQRWVASPDCSGWEPIWWPEGGEEAILGEAIWRAKFVPVGGPPGPNGLTAEPVHLPAGEPAYNVVDVDTSDASVEAVPWRGRLEPDQPRNFEMQIAAWFGAKFISDLLEDSTEAEVSVPADDAMAPSLWPNSAVLVDRRRTALRDGAVYEIETSDGLMFRRAIEHGKEWATAADDPKIMPRLWAETDAVVGQAIWTAGLMPGVQTALRI